MCPLAECDYRPCEFTIDVFAGDTKGCGGNSGYSMLATPLQSYLLGSVGQSTIACTGSLILGSVRLRGECIMTLDGHEDWVRTANFSPDGIRLRPKA